MNIFIKNKMILKVRDILEIGNLIRETDEEYWSTPKNQVLDCTITKEGLKRIRNMVAAFSKLHRIIRGTAPGRRKSRYMSRNGGMAKLYTPTKFILFKEKNPFPIYFNLYRWLITKTSISIFCKCTQEIHCKKLT